MFRKKDKQDVIYVDNVSELKDAMACKKNKIVVAGILARKMLWMTRLSKASVVALLACLPAAVVPNPASGVAFATAAGIVGKDVALIIFTGSISITLIIGILKDYEVKVGGEFEDKAVKLELTHKSSGK